MVYDTIPQIGWIRAYMEGIVVTQLSPILNAVKETVSQ